MATNGAHGNHRNKEVMAMAPMTKATSTSAERRTNNKQQETNVAPA